MKDTIRESLTQRSKSAKLETRGKIISLSFTAVIVILVISIIGFVAAKGSLIFIKDGVNPFDFLTHTTWKPNTLDANGHPIIGAAPMIVGSFVVTLFAAIIATPFAIAAAVYMTEISSKWGKKILQPVIELLVGIPSVVYGFIGLTVVVPFVKDVAGGSGLGVLSGAFVLFVMILPTITSMTVDALKAVPRNYREASLALGATRWQTTSKVVLRAATPGILTAIIFGMSRAFGEALAVQMVIGNAMLMPTSLVSPSSTLTSVLTMNMGNSVQGSTSNNALWSLALILLLMSLIFNTVTRAIAKRGEF
ncbi:MULTISPECIES: phosphate ABC transporter permease subunit PstC [Lactobacillaceae]|uniref:phosphate ABC transporter permease subunit PstC n=1 Tax=Lactobacillaceae TaxID=33958 RepID=UPI000C1B6B17|nr:MULTISPECIES: phosphate ABC transporter permease subunit PstC [Lactobacillaceae]